MRRGTSARAATAGTRSPDLRSVLQPREPPSHTLVASAGGPIRYRGSAPALSLRPE